MRLPLKILLILAITIILFSAITIIFLQFWPAFGGKVNPTDKVLYLTRSKNYWNNSFHNLTNKNSYEIPVINNFISNKNTIPKTTLPTVKPIMDGNIDEVSVTWFGHSSYLLQMNGCNILMDPILSNICSPVPFIGIKRFSEIPITPEELPEIDVLMLTHDHYDHLDLPTIIKVDKKVKKYIVPLGVEKHLERFGINPKKIQNMAWNEETELNGLKIICAPAQHFSNRKLRDMNQTLWASWIFTDGIHKLFATGDTGYGKHFEKIHDQYGDMDYIITECGQYSLNWPKMHMFPEEAATLPVLFHAKAVLPVHWGAFKLSQHPWDDSVERFTLAMEKTEIFCLTPYIGETVHFSHPNNYTTRWWRNYF